MFRKCAPHDHRHRQPPRRMRCRARRTRSRCRRDGFSGLARMPPSSSARPRPGSRPMHCRPLSIVAPAHHLLMVVCVRVSSTSADETMPDIDLEHSRRREATGARGGDGESSARGRADPLQHPYGPKARTRRGGALPALRRPPAAAPGAKWLSLDPSDTMSRAGSAGAACISDLGTEHAK